MMLILIFLNFVFGLKIGIYSDIHLEIDYKEGTCRKIYCNKLVVKDCDSKDNPEDIFYFGRYGCNPPIQLMEAITKDLKAKINESDIIFYLGDAISHYMVSSYIEDTTFNNSKYEEIKSIMRMVSDNAISTFNSLIIYVYGNSDYIFKYVPPDINHKYDYYNFLYKHWIQSNKKMSSYINKETRRSFLNGGYYIITIKNLNILVLNSAYFHQVNNFDLNVADEQLVWLESKLMQSKYDLQDVLILMHLPPGSLITPLGEETFWKEKYSQRFFYLVEKYKDVIKLCIAAHIHQSRYFSKISENSISNKTEYFSNFYMVKAVSPIYRNNPGYSILYLDSRNNPLSIEETSLVLDQCLRTTNADNCFEKTYNSSEHLQMENLNATSIGKFMDLYDSYQSLKVLWDNLKYGKKIPTNKTNQ